MQAAVAAVDTAVHPPTVAESAPEASTSTVFPTLPLPDDTLSHRERIERALEGDDRPTLRALASEGAGFEDSELRRRVWPVLLGCDVKGKQRAREDDPAQGAAATLAALPVREDERQVHLDIARSLISYPEDVTDENREELRGQLETAILTVLRRHPALQYFQGYHDIVSVLLLTLREEELVIASTERLSLHRIRDNMGSGLEPTLGYLKLVDRIVEQADPELYRIINQAASMPFFALSWALTLFSHDLESVAVISRLFDFLLAHNPAMICYLVVAILLTKKDDVVAVATANDDDPAIIHSALSQLPHIVLAPEPSPSAKNPPAPAASDAETEDLMSSASFIASSSDLARSPSFNATSDSELDESVISHGDVLERSRISSFSGYEGEDDDLHAFTDSMLSDPDIDGPAFDPLPLARTRTSSTSSASTTADHRTSRSGVVFLPSRPRRASSASSRSERPPRRTVFASDLIASALSHWRAHPLTASAPGGEAGDGCIRADEVLGPNSCVFTYEASESGALGDEAAEEIIRSGGGIVFPEALVAKPPLRADDAEFDEADEMSDEGDDGDDEGAEGDDYELVDSPASASASKRRRRAACRAHRRSSSATVPGGGAGRLNLGPHGWLVVGGVAIAGVAVALGVYHGGGGGAVPGHAPSSPDAGGGGGFGALGGWGMGAWGRGGGGLGTAGVGLGAGGGGSQAGSPALGGGAGGFVVQEAAAGARLM
ncbi:GTPase-activating protein GYP8 [Rhodotorula paludigena]|uniref:GTPase-activating protein GYP8 n=1 Tax=Rhodotorula paludigena TaxID=86838 RepID=UPI00316B2ABD